ncbi:MAG: hypothetical protein WB382_14045 [Pseudolabrys sp.]
MSGSNQQTDPNNPHYYAPRRPSNRVSTLRVTRLRSGESKQSIPTASLERPSFEPRAYDRGPLPYDRGSLSDRLPEVLRRPEPDAMQSLLRASQRARKNQVLALAIRFAAVAGLAAGIAFVCIVNFTGFPSPHAVTEAADSTQNVTSIEPAQKTIAPK